MLHFLPPFLRALFSPAIHSCRAKIISYFTVCLSRLGSWVSMCLFFLPAVCNWMETMLYTSSQTAWKSASFSATQRAFRFFFGNKRSFAGEGKSSHETIYNSSVLPPGDNYSYTRANPREKEARIFTILDSLSQNRIEIDNRAPKIKIFDFHTIGVYYSSKNHEKLTTKERVFENWGQMKSGNRERGNAWEIGKRKHNKSAEIATAVHLGSVFCSN